MAESDDTAVLEVSSESKTLSLKNENRDSFTDVSNYSTSVDGSMVQSLSIESFSFIPDQDGFDFGLDIKDLLVRVDNPQKHLDPFETYITFRVTTKTCREEYSEREYIVRRRYNDFLWLRLKLVESYPTHLIPPLPGKHTLLAQLDRYSKEFIQCRMAMLHRFINRIVNHPILSYHSSVQIFLTAKPSEFSIHRRNSSSLIGRMTGSLQQLTSVYMCRHHEPEFEAIKEYLSVLSDKLVTVERIGDRIYKERKEYIGELNQFSPVITMWASIEPSLQPLLIDIAAAVEVCSTSQQMRFIDTFQSNFSQPLKEYQLYIESIREALLRRDAIQLDYEISVEEMNKKKLEKDQLMDAENRTSQSSTFSLWKSATDRLTREDKLDKLSLTIPRLVKTVEANQDRMEIANEELRADLDRWKVEKKQDIKRLLSKLAEQHILYYQECLEAWEKVLPTLKATNSSPL